MSGYTRWDDIRAAHVARAGGEEAVAAGKHQLLTEQSRLRITNRRSIFRVYMSRRRSRSEATSSSMHTTMARVSGTSGSYTSTP